MIRLAAIAAALLTASAAIAQDARDALMDALEVDRVVELMRAESLERGEELADDLFPSTLAADGWRAELERIYDEDVMRQRMRGGLEEGLEGRDVDAMTDFFASETGRRIVESELAAREGMMDPDVEEAARATWGLLPEEDPERHGRIERFVAVNDLVEINVEGALNAHLDFLRGLAEGGAWPEAMGEADMLAEVWGSEGAVREELQDWLGAHLVLAYEPLEDDELDAYIAFSGSEAGQALNRALFDGFDAMYDGISFALGAAAAERMVGFDL